jgi:hypothetical protein
MRSINGWEENMKLCQKCCKEFDNSWTVCINCGSALVDPDLAAGRDDLREIKREINAVRDEMQKLIGRINIVENSVARREDEAVRIKDVAREECVEKNTIESKGESFFERLKDPAKPRFTRQQKAPITPIIVTSKNEVHSDENDPKKDIESFEQTIGAKWFNKIGVFAVVIGMALLLGYSFQYLGVVGKLALGCLTGLAMLIFGRRIEKKDGFSVYGKGLIAGGWAIIYFTSYAMYHIPAVRVISNPYVGMLLLLCVASATIADIYRYRSQTGIAFAYLLIFISLMVTPVSFYTMAAAIPVALSLVFFMRKMDWIGFGIYGMIMTYLAFMGWFLVPGTAHNTLTNTSDLLIASAFLVTYWAIFVAATLLVKDDGNNPIFISDNASIGLKAIYHIINTIIAICLGLQLAGAGSGKYLYHFISTVGLLYLGLTLVTYVRKERVLYIISSVVSVLFAAMYIAMKYSGYNATVYYIILTQILLLAGVSLKERFWRALALIGLSMIAFKLFIVDSFIVKNYLIAGQLSARTLLYSFALAIYFLNYMIYKKMNEAGLSVESEKFAPDLLSYMPSAIYAMGTWLDMPKILTAPCWILLSVFLLLLGIRKDNRHYRIQGYVLAIGAFLRLLMSNMLIQGGISIISYRFLTCVPVLLLLGWSSMVIRDEKTGSLLHENEKKMILLYPYMIFVIIMFLIRFEVSQNMVAPFWSGIAIAYSLLAVRSRSSSYMVMSAIAAIAAGYRAFNVNLMQSKYLVGAVDGNAMFALATAALLFIANVVITTNSSRVKEIEESGSFRLKPVLRSSRTAFSVIVAVLVTAIIMIKLTGVLVTLCLGLEGLVLFILGFVFKDKNWRTLGLVILLGTIGKAFFVDLSKLGTIYYIFSIIILGLALLFVSYIYTKHKDEIRKFI